MRSPLLKLLSLLPSNRYFQFVFWTMVIGLVVMIGVVILIKLDTVSSMELSLLDLKLQYRSDKIPGGHSAPSKDIVLIGMDENTNKYIRMHPEMGFSSLTLPRETLAEILDHLTDQGAKAVIFDYEFKEPKKGDDKLAAAIRRNGHVYASNRMDNAFQAFFAESKQSIAHEYARNQVYFTEVFFYEALLKPYMTHLSDTADRFLPHPRISPLNIGVGPYFPIFSYIEPDLWQLTRSLNFMKARGTRPVSGTLLSGVPVYGQPAYSDLLEQAFSPMCTHVNYAHSFSKDTKYLSLLAQQRLNVNVEGVIPDEINRVITHCYTYPTVDQIMEGLVSVGIPSIDYDDDAYIRSSKVIYRGYKGNFYTYLGIRPAIDLLGINTITYSVQDPARQELGLNGRKIPLLDGQQVIINWRDPKLLVADLLREHHLENDPQLMEALEHVKSEKNNPILGDGHIYRMVSAIDVIRTIRKHKMTDEEKGRLYNIPHHPSSGLISFKDKIVIIGNTVTDIHRTPMSNTMFGPEVVGAVLDMFLHDDMFIRKPPAAVQWAAVAVLSVGIAIAIITFENLAIGFTVGIMLVVLYWVLSIIVFVYLGLWLEMLFPSIGMGLSLTASTLYRYYVHDQEKHHLTNVFSKYVSPQVMEEIVKNPEKALDNLKGGKKELTVLFSDLQGFTQQFENADPEMMVSQLNEYFDIMTEIILDHGGTYDKYMGDSIMAFFGAPTDMADHAEMACRAAIEMQRALRILNERWAAEGRKILAHGVGIASGEMFVGNFGSKNIKNFTVMGSNVNLGSRLEAFTRVARWPIIISVRTMEMAAGKIKVRDLGKIQVKGFTDAVQIYGLEGMTVGDVTIAEFSASAEDIREIG